VPAVIRPDIAAEFAAIAVAAERDPQLIELVIDAEPPKIDGATIELAFTEFSTVTLLRLVVPDTERVLLMSSAPRVPLLLTNEPELNSPDTDAEPAESALVIAALLRDAMPVEETVEHAIDTADNAWFTFTLSIAALPRHTRDPVVVTPVIVATPVINESDVYVFVRRAP
jgi:hypothetical protein